MAHQIQIIKDPGIQIIKDPNSPCMQTSPLWGSSSIEKALLPLTKDRKATLASGSRSAGGHTKRIGAPNERNDALDPEA